MSDNKKYYYLKLKENFFETEDMKLLQSMRDGYLYSDILLKLYLRSLHQGGRLMYRDIIPYTPEMIAAITNHQVGTVERAVDVLKQMHFIEILDNGAIYMNDLQNFIGQSSSEADRKRIYRQTINAEKSMLLSIDTGTNVGTDNGTKQGQMSGHLSDEYPPEIRDNSLDIKDKENINILARSSGKQTSEPYADVEALLLNDGSEWKPTESLFAEYVRLYPNVDVKQQFNEMRSWCLSNPNKRKTKKGVTRFVNSWLGREQDKGYRKPINTPSPKSNSGYSTDQLSRLENENRGDLNA